MYLSKRCLGYAPRLGPVTLKGLRYKTYIAYGVGGSRNNPPLLFRTIPKSRQLLLHPRNKIKLRSCQGIYRATNATLIKRMVGNIFSMQDFLKLKETHHFGFCVIL
ncbi:MAG: hypothetical protein CM1200mP40_27860 [Gammaproteobacteria bacterium]|nr:MAG: hypothetical protein CM1200mP40_27860 [Gammaproteobacteria bacterium]